MNTSSTNIILRRRRCWIEVIHIFKKKQFCSCFAFSPKSHSGLIQKCGHENVSISSCKDEQYAHAAHASSRGTQMWNLLRYEWAFCPGLSMDPCALVRKDLLVTLGLMNGSSSQSWPYFPAVNCHTCSFFLLFNCTLEGNKESTCSSAFKQQHWHPPAGEWRMSLSHSDSHPIFHWTSRLSCGTQQMSGSQTVWWARLPFRNVLGVGNSSLCSKMSYTEKNIDCGYSKGKKKKWG